MKRWRWISICGFEGMFARVAQWWSIALPRRGSRVRIPSRALNEIEKRVIRWMALFSMFEPSRARTVRMSPLRSGRRRRTSPGRSATSRALNDTKKEISVGYLLFCMFEPCRVRKSLPYLALVAQQIWVPLFHNLGAAVCRRCWVGPINGVWLKCLSLGEQIRSYEKMFKKYSKFVAYML